MLSAVLGVVDKDREEIEAYAKKILEEERETLEVLAELRIRGELTNDEFLSELEDEKDTVAAQLNALTVMSKAMAEKAANAAIDVLV